MVEQMNPSVQKLFDEKTKLRSKLAKERDALKKSIENSPAYLAFAAREKELKKECDNLCNQIDKLVDAVRSQFLTDDRLWAYYSRAGSYRLTRSTNIQPHVLDAIGKVAPISKLTDENIKDTVKALIEMATNKNAAIMKLREQYVPLSSERDALQHKRWEMDRDEQVIELDGRICSLWTELRSLEEQLQHPERVRNRSENELVRERLKRPDNLRLILSHIEKHEAR
jgi:hypothetical protein